MGRRSYLLAVAIVVIAMTASGCDSADTAGTTASAAAKPHRAAAESQPNDITPARQNAALIRFAAKHRPVFCGGRKQPWVAFTFDDGPGPYTKHMVGILKHFRVPATWFVVGRNVAPRKSSLMAEQRVGPIGDHSWSHPYLKSMTANEVNQQITSTAGAISRAGGRPVRLFRPPYGARNATVDSIARREHMVQILWNVDSEDALGANHKKISRNVIKGLHAGSIVLMHENRGQTIRALRFKILPHLKKMNLKLVTVPQMLAGNPPTARQLSRGRKGCS